MLVPRSGVMIATVLVMGATGCVRPAFPGSERFFPSRDVLPRRPGSDTTSAQDGSAMAMPARKQVSDKEAPSSLIARDGSRCTVTAKRFSETRVGEEAWCAWTSGR
jgi:hypothetical protein